jgi:tRNA isopentenyl-2-thiomethyl-A-37 hydroxylase MiaE
LHKLIISLFSNTFKAPYFEYLVRSSAQHFTDLVVIAERVEQAIVIGKIADPIENNGFGWKREGH